MGALNQARRGRVSSDARPCTRHMVLSVRLCESRPSCCPKRVSVPVRAAVRKWREVLYSITRYLVLPTALHTRAPQSPPESCRGTWVVRRCGSSCVETAVHAAVTLTGTCDLARHTRACSMLLTLQPTYTPVSRMA